MNSKYNYLLDSSFLREMALLKNKTQYVKITCLSWNEKPIKELQAQVTGGSGSINGSSAVRRTANLSIIIQKDQDLSYKNLQSLLAINKKIRIEIGYLNTTNRYLEHPIIWYPQGYYVITSCQFNFSASGIAASLQLQDKMCLLNGTSGGVITSSTQFDKYDTVKEDGWGVYYPTLSTIISEAVNHLGQEQLSKIIIDGIDSRIKTVVKWTGSYPLYLIKNGTSRFLTTDQSKAEEADRTFSYGDDVGFIYSDFTYNQDLIANPGDNINSAVLEKIKSYLGGNFEYFYDTQGYFHFKEIKNYLNTTKAKNIITDMKKEDYILKVNKTDADLDLSDNKLIISASNSPQYENVKNDYVVWGVRKPIDGTTHPIRYHLAIDSKPNIPEEAKHLSNNEFVEIKDDFVTVWAPVYTDPYDKITKLASFRVVENKTEMIQEEGIVYSVIATSESYGWDGQNFVPVQVVYHQIKATDWRFWLYFKGWLCEFLGLTGQEDNYYYPELKAEFPKIFDLTKGQYYPFVEESPEELDYWLDFIDSNELISELSVQQIGRRSIATQSNNINCIFEPTIPDMILIQTGQKDTEEKRHECEDRGQEYIQVDPGIYSQLAIGGRMNGAYTEIKNLLYTYTHYNETVNLQILPLLELEPNTRVSINIPECGIRGDYLITNISVPYDINSNMSVTATKIIDKL